MTRINVSFESQNNHEKVFQRQKWKPTKNFNFVENSIKKRLQFCKVNLIHEFYSGKVRRIASPKKLLNNKKILRTFVSVEQLAD